MINVIIDILKDLGVKFLKNDGKSVLCEYKGRKYHFFKNSPYKLYNTETLDLFKEIKKDKRFKQAHKEFTKNELNDLVTYGKGDPETFQHHVNTQNLESYPDIVTDFLDNYDILKVKSPMATRKSNVIQEVLKQSNKRGLKCIFITNRVSLANEIALKYKSFGICNYQESYKDNHLVVQFDSLYKFNVSNFDVVIMDEITSLLNYSLSQHNLKHYDDNLRLFLASGLHLKTVLLDAFIIDYPWERKEIGIYNHFRENHDVFIYEDKKMFIDLLKRDIRNGLRVCVSSNEKKFLEQLHDEFPESILHTAENKLLEAYIQQPDIKEEVILFSPTITVGVSIMRPFDRHYHYDTGNTIEPIDSIQMIRRARNVDEIHIFLRAKSSYLMTNLNRITRTLNKFVIKDSWGNITDISEIGKLFANVIRIHNIMKNSSKYAFLYMLQDQFLNINIIPKL